MEIIHNLNREQKEIAEAIKKVSPHTIAVAYVGKDWKSYCDTFKQIIVSPTVGTNPAALEEIISEIGIENVYFLDNLHSKIYLGTYKALVGSSNLSNNALSDHNLLETVVSISDRAELGKICSIIEEYKKLAIVAYPNETSKLERVKQLKKMPKLPPAKYSNTNLIDYDIAGSGYRIIIAWYLSEKDAGKKGVDYDFDYPEGLEENSDKWNNFLEDDDLNIGDRILNWEIKRRNGKILASKFSWFVVSDFLDNGVSGQGNYTKLVYQGKNITNFIPPFDVNDVAKKCFNEIINDTQFIDFSGNENEDWHIPSQAQTKKFLKAWQKAVRNATSK